MGLEWAGMGWNGLGRAGMGWAGTRCFALAAEPPLSTSLAALLQAQGLTSPHLPGNSKVFNQSSAPPEQSLEKHRPF